MHTVNHLLQAKGNRVSSVAPSDSVLRAIEIMATRHVGALLVMNGGTLLGIISERDYARKVILKNRSSHDTPVSDIMTSPAVSVTSEYCPSVTSLKPLSRNNRSTSSSWNATSRASQNVGLASR